MRKLYPFEGQHLALNVIVASVPVLSRHAVRRHLKAGRTTRQAMLAYDGTAQKRSAGKASRSAQASNPFCISGGSASRKATP